MDDRDDPVVMADDEIILEENFQKIENIIVFSNTKDPVRFDLLRKIKEIDLIPVLQFLKHVDKIPAV
jgi:hypothetical protein